MCWSESLLKKASLGGGGQFGLGKVLSGVNVLVWVHAFAQQKLSPFIAGLVPVRYFEDLGLLAATSLSREASRNWALSMNRSWSKEKEILLRVVWDASHSSLYLGDGLHQEVRVISPQIVEDNMYGCGLWAKTQFQVARVMSGTSVFSGIVAVVTHRITLKWFFTHMTSGGAVMSPPVLSCHPHGFGGSQHSFDFALLLLERF